MINKKKNINDPIYGFITIPNEFLFDVMEHHWFQRLRRIRQLGLTEFVYPSATHTRFQHALGCLFLMKQAIKVLREKGVEITEDEELGTWLAILLHDIGHGPYSHTLERSIVTGISHEEISLLFMERMNHEFPGELATAIRIFSNTYPKGFLHQLVSSQLDMDRLDYLTRDSFFTGVAEGVINTDRIINMLTVENDDLVVEEKGIYSIEKFILARRLMYWQVYLHKTVLAADFMLSNILRRSKILGEQGVDLFATPPLKQFLTIPVKGPEMLRSGDRLEIFSQLDDFDIFSAIKVWSTHPDPILSFLCRRLVNRHLFRAELRNTPFDPDAVARIREKASRQFGITQEETGYIVTEEPVSNDAYDPNHDLIRIRTREGELLDVSKASDQLNISVLSARTQKYLLSYPKELTDR
ncbi:MAG: HD domain-containing protein [Bacteroidales bacterium]|nr:HD domain-containing protein [Bacteroidales bacterium]